MMCICRGAMMKLEGSKGPEAGRMMQGETLGSVCECVGMGVCEGTLFAFPHILTNSHTHILFQAGLW